MTLRDGYKDNVPQFLTKRFKTVRDGESSPLTGVRATVHGHRDIDLTLRNLFAIVRGHPVGNHEICSAYEWDGKGETDAPVLISQPPRGEPRVIGKRVLNTANIGVEQYIDDMDAGHGRRHLYMRPEVNDDVRRTLEANVHNAHVVDRLVRLLEMPNIENDCGNKSSIDVFECPIGEQLLYALKYSNTMRVGSEPTDHASHTDYYVNFYDEDGKCLTADQLQSILQQNVNAPSLSL